MKAYFDNLYDLDSNLLPALANPNTGYWLIAPGSEIKNNLKSLGIELELLEQLTDPGCYYIDVNGDPIWWNGYCEGIDVPTKHLLDYLPQNILDFVRQKRLRLIINADREGGAMLLDGRDSFKATTEAMIRLNLPMNSILIAQGNKKVAKQYKQWLESTKTPRYFDIMYSNHFGRIFFNKHLPDQPVITSAIQNTDARDYNSLNRVYRPHRGAHYYLLSRDVILHKGIVSFNNVPEYLDTHGSHLVDLSPVEYGMSLKTQFIDGDWSVENAANKYNIHIYQNSLLTVVTETKFNEDVVFLTEKVFKPIALGHPMILFASAGTLRGLEELGFKIDWCGIDPSYNDIKDDKDRLAATHQVLVDWCNLPREEKILRIENSMETINHNFNLIRQRDFYKEALLESFEKTLEYFRD